MVSVRIRLKVQQTFNYLELGSPIRAEGLKQHHHFVRHLVHPILVYLSIKEVNVPECPA